MKIGERGELPRDDFRLSYTDEIHKAFLTPRRTVSVSAPRRARACAPSTPDRRRARSPRTRRRWRSRRDTRASAVAVSPPPQTPPTPTGRGAFAGDFLVAAGRRRRRVRALSEPPAPRAALRSARRRADALCVLNARSSSSIAPNFAERRSSLSRNGPPRGATSSANLCRGVFSETAAARRRRRRRAFSLSGSRARALAFAAEAVRERRPSVTPNRQTAVDPAQQARHRHGDDVVGPEGPGPVETRALDARSSEVEIVTFAVCVSGRDSATRRHTHERQMRRERGLRRHRPVPRPRRRDARFVVGVGGRPANSRESRASLASFFVFVFVPSASRRVGE